MPKSCSNKYRCTVFTSLLTSRYLRYKADTDIVASWLASTAKPCGYPTNSDIENNDRQDDNESQKGSDRLADKTRRQAKEAVSASPTQSPYIIAMKDFVRLAEVIASYNQKRVKVPLSVMSSLRSAISARKSYGAEVFSKLPQTPETEESNQRHLYFISVLEQVWDILLPLMHDHSTAQYSTIQAADTKGLSNMFEILEVYEPSEESLELPDSSPNMPKSKQESETVTAAQYGAEQFQDFQEALIVIKLAVGDMKTIRLDKHGATIEGIQYHLHLGHCLNREEDGDHRETRR